MVRGGSVIGFAAGYAAGARWGRKPYEAVTRRLRRGSGDDGDDARGTAADRAGRRPSDVREVMTAAPLAVSSDAPVAEAARLMADSDIGDVLILEAGTGRMEGILTDRDIAVRVAAEAKDPGTTKAGDVCTVTVTSIEPTTSVDEAVRTMRREDVRRLPVVEGGRPIGIVSLGDLAVALDPESALADISAAPPSD
jgi:CBS domain-containing protein